MNLSLIFLVLIAFLAYLLYDMFKKSRQQQELAQAAQPTRQTTTRLKPSYQSQCTILRQLHDQQTNNAKQKQISIHLQEDHEQPHLDTHTETHLLSLLQTLIQHYRIYVLICRKIPVKNGLIPLLKKAGAVEIGFQSNEGAVAVLRQLSCGVHLEGNFQLYKSLSQYLSAIWLAENGKQQGNPQFKSEVNMIMGLQSLTKRTGKQMKQQ